jgi:hypothetical protein
MVPHEFLSLMILTKPTGKRGQGPILANHTKRMELENLVSHRYKVKNLPKGSLTKVPIESRNDYGFRHTHNGFHKRLESREELSLIYGDNVIHILDVERGEVGYFDTRKGIRVMSPNDFLETTGIF